MDMQLWGDLVDAYKSTKLSIISLLLIAAALFHSELYLSSLINLLNNPLVRYPS